MNRAKPSRAQIRHRIRTHTHATATRIPDPTQDQLDHAITRITSPGNPAPAPAPAPARPRRHISPTVAGLLAWLATLTAGRTRIAPGREHSTAATAMGCIPAGTLLLEHEPPGSDDEPRIRLAVPVPGSHPAADQAAAGGPGPGPGDGGSPARPRRHRAVLAPAAAIAAIAAITAMIALAVSSHAIAAAIPVITSTTTTAVFAGLAALRSWHAHARLERARRTTAALLRETSSTASYLTLLHLHRTDHDDENSGR